MKNRVKLITSFLLGAILATAFTIFISPFRLRTIVAPANIGRIAAIEDVYHRLRDFHFFYDGDERALVNGAIEGMVNAIGDPNSTFFTMEDFRDFSSNLGESFYGIGAEVTTINGYTMIVSPFPGSPAEEAGLMANDVVITIDDENVVGRPLGEVISMIQGPEGTQVTMGIRRAGQDDLVYITPTRGRIPQESVRSELKIVDGIPIGYLRVLVFGEATAREFKEAITELEASGIQGLIVDVRNNTGGYLRAVIEMLDYLLPEGEVITSVVDRNGRGETFTSSGETEGKTYPIITLINGGSASASEIFAAAMKEAAGQEVVGMPSFGKGTVQVSLPLDDMHMLKITNQIWRTSAGNWINEEGVQPTITVEEPDFYFYFQVFLGEAGEVGYDTVSPAVQSAQNILNAVAGADIRSDGYFDQNTYLAVQDFQRDNNLEVTGTLNNETATALTMALRDRIRDPQYDTQLQRALEVLISE